MAAQAADRAAFREKTPAAIPEVYPQAVAAGHQQDVGAASLHFSSSASKPFGVYARPSKIPIPWMQKIERLVGNWLVTKRSRIHFIDKDTRLTPPGYKK